MFTWIYIKRAITVAFLTLMAPLVAITYPIDKINDGQAQAFDRWLKEYIFYSVAFSKWCLNLTTKLNLKLKKYKKKRFLHFSIHAVPYHETEIPCSAFSHSTIYSKQTAKWTAPDLSVLKP